MTRLEIHNICKKYGISGYDINDDMSISVDGSVDLSSKDLKSIPIKFKEVGGGFYCHHNQLTSLKYCPETAGGNFDCRRNQLTSLEGCPETVGGNFDCRRNQLTSLEGCPKYVGRSFFCKNNDLTSLNGISDHIGVTIYCQYNQITNFDGLPEFFEQRIRTEGNPIDEIYKLLYERPGSIYWIREFGVIQGDEVVRDRLEEVYHTLGMDIPKDIILKEYIIV